MALCSSRIMWRLKYRQFLCNDEVSNTKEVFAWGHATCINGTKNQQHNPQYCTKVQCSVLKTFSPRSTRGEWCLQDSPTLTQVQCKEDCRGHQSVGGTASLLPTHSLHPFDCISLSMHIKFSIPLKYPLSPPFFRQTWAKSIILRLGSIKVLVGDPSYIIRIELA